MHFARTEERGGGRKHRTIISQSRKEEKSGLNPLVTRQNILCTNKNESEANEYFFLLSDGEKGGGGGSALKSVIFSGEIFDTKLC